MSGRSIGGNHRRAGDAGGGDGDRPEALSRPRSLFARPPTDRDLVDLETDATPPVHPWGWHITRVSGLFLAVLVPLHFFVTVIIGNVGGANVAAANARLHGSTWRSLEWITIVLALGHGFFALQAAIAGSRRSVRGQEVLTVTLGVAAVLLAGAATVVLLTRPL